MVDVLRGGESLRVHDMAKLRVEARTAIETAIESARWVMRGHCSERM
jgi:hypothetical protein